MYGEQAWTENKRGYLISDNSLVCTTGVDLNKRGLEEIVDLNKAWTVSVSMGSHDDHSKTAHHSLLAESTTHNSKEWNFLLMATT